MSPLQNRTDLRPSSNAAAVLAHLAAAVREHGTGPSAIEDLLRRAARATGCERAFIVRAPVTGESPPAVIARAVARTGQPGGEPSRATVRLGLGSAKPRIWTIGGRDGTLLDGDSVRRLGLRAVLSAPLPAPAPPGSALVLDGRRPPRADASMLTSVLSAFAALVSQRIAQADCAERVSTDPGRELVGRSTAFREILLHASRAARCDLPVLIQGESGTGKEAVARQIHEAGSRRHGPFVAINCAAMPEGLMERELFGCVRGAYTGADRDSPGLFRAARGGTLLLDEIGDMPRSMQAKLLRTLQERRVRPLGGSKEIDVDVRLLAASHRHLESLVSHGGFRADLFFRLSVLRIRIPPLRDRIDDLSVLIPVLAARLSRQAGVPHVRLTDAAVQRLREHRWPGNVRELEAVLARAALRTGGGPVGTEDLEIESQEGFAPIAEGDGEPLEAAMIRAALARSGGNVPRAAGRIGWTRQKLHRRMQALGLRANGAAIDSESGEPGVPA